MKKANLTAAKIVPKRVYAIKHPSTGQLVRFVATSVTTTRFDNTGSPHDYKSTVNGFVVGESSNQLSLALSAVLGPYEEHVELVEQVKREKDASERLKHEERQQCLDAVRLIYRKLDIPVPNKLDDYNLPFRAEYTNGIDVSKEGLKLLADYFRRAPSVNDLNELDAMGLRTGYDQD